MKMILKRDGRRTKFDKEKIVNAIQKAFENTDGEVYDEYAQSKAENIANYIEDYVNSSDKMLGVEEIQDLVENGLMSCKKKNVAKEYILYRNMRTRVRKNKSEFNKKIGEKLTASNVQNSNANMDEYSFGGRIGEASSELTKEYALDNLISEKAVYNYKNNIVYIHDINSYATGQHNCLTVPIDDLLANGFNTRQTDVRPANSVNTAFQLIAVLFQIQSLQQFGGVSASHIDWSLVPYVRKSLFKHYLMEYLKDTDDFYLLNLEEMDEDELDNWIDSHKVKYLSELNLVFEDFYFGSTKLDEKYYKRAFFETRRETYQAVEGMLHNLNTLMSRSGCQLPFSSINYGTCTLEEGRLVTKAILESTIKGIGKLHRTSVFPCQIFKVKKGINKEPNTPNYDLYKLALKCTSLRLYPNYANVDWSTNQVGNDGSIDAEMSTMGKV